MKNKKILIIVILLIIILSCFGVYYLLVNSNNDKVIDFTKEKNSVNEWSDVNSNVVGKLIFNDELELPVLKGNDNEFYLNNSLLDEVNNQGVPFIDVNINKPYDNLVIYGNNTNDYSIFSFLDNYFNEEYLKENSIVSYEDENGLKEYNILAINKSIPDKAIELIKYDFINFDDKVSYLSSFFKEADYVLNEVIHKEKSLMTLVARDLDASKEWSIILLEEA